MLGLILSRHGVTVLAASDREELVALATRNRFELALIDLDLAMGEPLQLVGRLRRLQPQMTIAMTYNEAPPETLDALRSGQAGILLLHKPISLQALRDLLDWIRTR